MYSLVHLHLLLNHFPIILTLIGFVLIAFTVFKRQDGLSRVGLAMFVAAGVFTLPTYLTGEPAEDVAKHLPDVTKALIHQHEDVALKAAYIVGVLAIFSLWALWRYRRPASLSVWAVRVAALVGLFGAMGMSVAGLYGGEIRHTEVRPGFVESAQ